MKARYRWIVAAVAAVVLATSAPASACSCAPGDARTQLKAADAAIIGTLLSKTPDGDWSATYTFKVDEEVKGDFDETVAISSASDGAACGLEVRPGGQTGLFLRGSHADGWSSSLCEQISPRELREAAEPMPAPDGEGPISMLVGGKWGDMGMIALDAQGRTLAYGRRPGGSTVAAVCPGSTRFLEVPWRGEGRFVVRDTSTFEVLEVIELPDKTAPWPVWCLDRDAREILFGDIDYNEPTSRSRLYRYRDGTLETLYRGTSSGLEPVGDRLYLTEGRYGRKLTVLDLGTGDKRLIARAPRYVQGVSVSPGGTKLVTSAGADREKLVTVDMSTSPATVRVLDHGIGMDGETYWLDDETFVYLPGGYDNSKVKVFDDELNLIRRLEGHWYTDDEELAGSTAYGIGWGGLYRAALPDGPAEVLREFPTTWLHSLELVPDEVHAQAP